MTGLTETDLKIADCYSRSDSDMLAIQAALDIQFQYSKLSKGWPIEFVQAGKLATNAYKIFEHAAIEALKSCRLLIKATELHGCPPPDSDDGHCLNLARCAILLDDTESGAGWNEVFIPSSIIPD